MTRDAASSPTPSIEPSRLQTSPGTASSAVLEACPLGGASSASAFARSTLLKWTPSTFRQPWEAWVDLPPSGSSRTDDALEKGRYSRETQSHWPEEKGTSEAKTVTPLSTPLLAAMRASTCRSKAGW
eukprot:scaffold59241_cov57-Phaeocystis_antarctica.AAC.7